MQNQFTTLAHLLLSQEEIDEVGDRIVLRSKKNSQTGCIELVVKGSCEYGRVMVTTKRERPKMQFLAHRCSVEALIGRLGDRQWVIHRCDNPRCIHPAHLLPGDKAANDRDKIAKGRQSRGEIARKSHLTESDIIEMRTMRSHGKSTLFLARRFKISIGVVSRICRGETWAHVGGQRTKLLSACWLSRMPGKRISLI